MIDEPEVEGDEPEADDDAFQHTAMSSILGRREPAAQDQGEQAAEQPEPTAQPNARDAPAPEAKPHEATPASDDDEPTDWKAARQALKSVTERNKALERQIEDLTRKVMAPANPPDEPELPDPLTDPDGFRSALDQERFTERVALTRELMIDSVGEEKFAAAEAAFIQAASADPQLAAQLRRSANPAKFAFQQGSKLIEGRADPAKDRERLEAEITEKVMARLGLKPDGSPLDGKPAAQPNGHRPVTPTSLANARSAAGPSGPTWDGPRPLSSLIGPRRK